MLGFWAPGFSSHNDVWCYGVLVCFVNVSRPSIHFFSGGGHSFTPSESSDGTHWQVNRKPAFVSVESEYLESRWFVFSWYLQILKYPILISKKPCNKAVNEIASTYSRHQLCVGAHQSDIEQKAKENTSGRDTSRGVGVVRRFRDRVQREDASWSYRSGLTVWDFCLTKSRTELNLFGASESNPKYYFSANLVKIKYFLIQTESSTCDKKLLFVADHCDCVKVTNLLVLRVNVLDFLLGIHFHRFGIAAGSLSVLRVTRRVYDAVCNRDCQNECYCFVSLMLQFVRWCYGFVTLPLQYLFAYPRMLKNRTKPNRTAQNLQNTSILLRMPSKSPWDFG